MQKQNMLDFNSIANKLTEILGLETAPVAVFLTRKGESTAASNQFKPVSSHRYCQLLMRARRGESLVLEPDELSCPAAAAAFGFRPLPEGLATGKGLVGFGIVFEPSVGKAMFEGMTSLAADYVEKILVCPLDLAPEMPDVVVVEGQPEQLMWLALADLNLAGGACRRADTAVLQATCVDATIIPFAEQRMNFSLGCYGCREATDMKSSETILGFPGTKLENITSALEQLNAKAIGQSRSKNIYRHFLQKEQS